jgi:phosphonopyruvate decarboxylase
MNLGSLVTIASQKPPNLLHFVCENGAYEANGNHPIPGRDVVSFAAFARAAGYPKTYEIAELAAFESQIAGLLREEGPIFVTLKLVPGDPPPQDYAYIHGPAAREAFRAALRR